MNEKDSIVKKSDEMIADVRYELTLTQYKLILFVMARIRVADEDFKTYDIPILEMVASTGLSPEGAYTRVEKEAIALMKKVWKIKKINPEGKQETTALAWFSAFHHTEGSGSVQVRFDPGLKPYLLQLKSHFTTYPLACVLALRSVYSIRLYELLKKEAAFKSSVSFDLEAFKQTLQIDEKPYFSQYSNIKAFVLLPSKKEISAKTDLKVLKIKEKKQGRKVIGFTIFFEKSLTEIEQVREEVLKSLNINESILPCKE